MTRLALHAAMIVLGAPLAAVLIARGTGALAGLVLALGETLQ